MPEFRPQHFTPEALQKAAQSADQEAEVEELKAAVNLAAAQGARRGIREAFQAWGGPASEVPEAAEAAPNGRKTAPEPVKA